MIERKMTQTEIGPQDFIIKNNTLISKMHEPIISRELFDEAQKRLLVLP